MDLTDHNKLKEEIALQEAASVGLKSMEHLIQLVSNQNHNQLFDCREIVDFTYSKFKKMKSIQNRIGHARFRRGPVHPPQQHQPSTVLTPVPHNNLPSAVFSPIQHHNLPSAFFTPIQHHNLTSASTQQCDLPAPKIYRPKPLNLFIHSPVLSGTPEMSPSEMQAPPLTLDFTLGTVFQKDVNKSIDKEGFTIPAVPLSNSANSFLSSITSDQCNVSKEISRSPVFVLPPPVSTNKPPISGEICGEQNQSDKISVKTTESTFCHCKKRKFKVKQVIRVPAMSSKLADVPPDEFSWRKYGQKSIKGSPYPRNYYKCSGTRCCPARKHIERATDDPSMLIVTYEGEHKHIQDAMEKITAADELK